MRYTGLDVKARYRIRVGYAGGVRSEILRAGGFAHPPYASPEIDFPEGVDIVKRAVEEPTRALAENAGVEGSIVVQEIKRRKGNDGYNVSTGEYEDLVKAGVVDPKKVTRTALQNAASIAGLLLTTECLITEVPEKEKAAPAGHGPGGMGGGMDY